MKRVLNAGCGLHHLIPDGYKSPEWEITTLDIDPDVGADLVCSVVSIPEESDTFDAVYCSQTLEHLYPHEVPLALAEFYRVLKPTGFVVIVVPDLYQAATLVAMGKAEQPVMWVTGEFDGDRAITALDMIFGHRASIAKGQTAMAHHTGFTRQTLQEELERAGFTPVQTRLGEHFNLYGTGHASKIEGSVAPPGSPTRHETGQRTV